LGIVVRGWCAGDEVVSCTEHAPANSKQPENEHEREVGEFKWKKSEFKQEQSGFKPKRVDSSRSIVDSSRKRMYSTPCHSGSISDTHC
jgi:hypothetical protein